MDMYEVRSYISVYSYELLLYPGENSPWHPLHRRLGENPNRYG
jgi:hypothetical protein